MDMNFNVNPYYDDFDESKNYLKILFKPGYAVQARELTQLQTSLQKQISRFGSHIFKDGSIVLNGSTTTTNGNWIDVTTPFIPTTVGIRYTGVASGAECIVFKVVQQNTSTTARLYFTYTTGTTFQQNEQIVASETGTYQIRNDVAFTGPATAYSIVDSVFFVKGHFVFCNAQTIILSDTTDAFTKKVGLVVEESIVDSSSDFTLLDPAQGSYNYAAPGADRYSISLTLSSFTYDPQTVTNDVDNFIELSRFEKNKLVFNITSASYADLETTLARRTYDESGDYTVRAFGLNVKDHIFGDPLKLSLGIEPGKAYVKGYEFETIATTHVDLDKARDYSTISEYSVEADYGSYFLVNAPSGARVDYTSNPAVTIKDGTSATIGTANIAGIQYAGSLGSPAAARYKLYLFNIVFNSGKTAADARTITSGSWTTTVPTTGDVYPNNIPFLTQGQRKTLIVPLPNAPIKTLLTTANSLQTETDYETWKTFTVSFSNGVGVPINTITGETLPYTSATDYIVTTTAGVLKPVASVGGTSTAREINLVDTSPTTGTDATAHVLARVVLTDQDQKNKTLQSYTLTGAAIASTVSLTKSDCYKLVSVIARDTAVSSPLADLNVTGYFDFDTGQKDDLYDHGAIYLKSGVTIPAGYDVLDITFEYFTHSSANGFFSVDSYPADVPYTSIPQYTSSSGETFNLRDCIDFRPRRTDGTTTITGLLRAVPSSLVRADYEYYLPRTDKLALTKERKFTIIKGIPSDYPEIPKDLIDAMTMYIINVPAYTDLSSDVQFQYIDNRRYTMRDIGKIEKRVDRLEYYTALSMLEKQAKDEQIYDTQGVERFKNGILVDSFAGHSVGDVNNSEYSCSIEPETRTLRPRFAPYSFTYNVNSLSNAVQVEDLVTLPYTSELFTVQPFATRTVNLNPYQVFSWNGIVDLTPATDTWVDTETKPDVVVNLNGENDVFTVLTNNVKNPASVGVRWNDWQTINRGVEVTDNITTNRTNRTTGTQNITQTTTTNNQTTTVSETLSRTGVGIATSAVRTINRDLGSRVVDTSIVPFIRSRNIRFAGRHLKPKTNLVAMFDGVDVTKYCTPADEIEFTTQTFNKKAKRLRKVGDTTKEAKVIFGKKGRAFVVMDNNKNLFEAGDILEWFVDGAWSSPSTVTVATGGVTNYERLKTNEYGDVAGIFRIPNSSDAKFRTGERIFRLADGVGERAKTAAEATYVASGLSQSVERTIVATRVARTSIFPTQESTTRTKTSTDSIVVSRDTVVKDITPPKPPVTPMVFTCPEGTSGNGQTGRHEYTINFTAGIGVAGISFKPSPVPSRYTLIWDGKSFTTGFVGDPSYNAQLAKLGLPNVVGSSPGKLTFNKTKATPSTATLIINAPITGTEWNFKVLDCPTGTVVPPTYTDPPIVQPDPIPAKVVNAEVTVSDTANANLPIVLFTGGVTTAGTRTLAGSTRVRANSAVSASAKYKLVSLTISPSTNLTLSGFTLNQPLAITTPVSFNVNVAAGTATGTYTRTITAQWEYVGGDTGTAPTSPLTATANVTVNVQAIERGDFRIDPVAQTFYVDGRVYPNGIFVNKIDLYFATKSTRAPVTVQIRPTVNGYPSSDTVLPFAVSTKEPDDILISTTGATATTFEFDNIVHLAPGEYAFVVMTDSIDYEIYTAAIGEFSITNSNKRVTKQPVLGSMFKSQNASTWTAIQEEDVKFQLHKCVFDTSLTGTVIYNTDIESTDGDVEYDVFYTMGETVGFVATSTSYEFKPNNQAWTPYQLGSNVTLSERKTLTAATPSSLQFKTIFSTTDRNVTPIIDTNRLSSTLVRNLINDVTTAPTIAPTSIVSGIRYEIVSAGDTDFTAIGATNNNVGTVFTATTTVIAATSIVSGAKYQIVSAGDTNFVSIGAANNTPGTIFTATGTGTGTGTVAIAGTGTVVISEEYPVDGFADATYITRKVVLNPGFESSDLKVQFNANIPSGTGVRVYYRVATPADTFFDDNLYQPMVLESAGAFTETGYPEYKYKTPYTVSSESKAFANGDRFNTFAVKIVMTSTNPVKVPTIRDLRVVAIDE